jgi:hypothetical protein
MASGGAAFSFFCAIRLAEWLPLSLRNSYKYRDKQNFFNIFFLFFSKIYGLKKIAKLYI